MNPRRSTEFLVRLLVRTAAVLVGITLWGFRPAFADPAGEWRCFTRDPGVRTVDDASAQTRVNLAVAPAAEVRRPPELPFPAPRALARAVFPAPSTDVSGPVSDVLRTTVYRYAPRMECGEPPRA